MDDQSGLKPLLRGALGGLLGGLAMKALVHTIDPNSFGLSAQTDARATHKLYQKLGLPQVSHRQASQIGAAMHYGFSVLAGAGYGVAVNRNARLRFGSGMLFGVALWLLGDELAVSVSGLENPLECPAFSHLTALGAHLAYGRILNAIVD